MPEAALFLADLLLPWRRPRRRARACRLARDGRVRGARCLVAASMLLAALQPRAWDIERMLASAHRLGPQAVAGTLSLQSMMQSAVVEAPRGGDGGTEQEARRGGWASGADARIAGPNL